MKINNFSKFFAKGGGDQNFFVDQKKISARILFWPKKIYDQKFFSTKNFFRPKKKYGHKKLFLAKQFLSSKNIFYQKSIKNFFGPKTFLDQNFFHKKLFPTKFFFD